MIMRALSAAALLALFIAILPSKSTADDTSFAGTWRITGTLANKYGSETINPTCTFKVDGDQVSGSCKSGNAMGSIDGSVDGDSIVWHWDRIATGPPVWDATLTFRAKMGSDGTMQGEFKDSVIGDDVGTFV